MSADQLVSVLGQVRYTTELALPPVWVPTRILTKGHAEYGRLNAAI